MVEIAWDKIRERYESDPSTSFRKLADEFGVHYKVIGRRSKSDGWVKPPKAKAPERPTAPAGDNPTPPAPEQEERPVLICTDDELYDELVFGS